MRADIEVIERPVTKHVCPVDGVAVFNPHKYNSVETRYIRKSLTKPRPHDDKNTITDSNGIVKVKRKVRGNRKISKLDLRPNCDIEADYDEYDDIFPPQQSEQKHTFDLTINEQEVERVIAENKAKYTQLYPCEFMRATTYALMRIGKTGTDTQVYLGTDVRQRERQYGIFKDVQYHFVNCEKIFATEEELNNLIISCYLRVINDACNPYRTTGGNDEKWQKLPQVPIYLDLRTLLERVYALMTAKPSKNSRTSRLAELIRNNPVMYNYLTQRGAKRCLLKKIFHINTAYKRYYRYCDFKNCLPLRGRSVRRPIFEVINEYSIFDADIQVKPNLLPIDKAPGEVTMKDLFEYRTCSQIDDPEEDDRPLNSDDEHIEEEDDELEDETKPNDNADHQEFHSVNEFL